MMTHTIWRYRYNYGLQVLEQLPWELLVVEKKISESAWYFFDSLWLNVDVWALSERANMWVEAGLACTLRCSSICCDMVFKFSVIWSALACRICSFLIAAGGFIIVVLPAMSHNVSQTACRRSRTHPTILSPSHNGQATSTTTIIKATMKKKMKTIYHVVVKISSDNVVNENNTIQPNLNQNQANAHNNNEVLGNVPHATKTKIIRGSIKCHGKLKRWTHVTTTKNRKRKYENEL